MPRASVPVPLMLALALLALMAKDASCGVASHKQDGRLMDMERRHALRALPRRQANQSNSSSNASHHSATVTLLTLAQASKVNRTKPADVVEIRTELKDLRGQLQHESTSKAPSTHRATLLNARKSKLMPKEGVETSRRHHHRGRFIRPHGRRSHKHARKRTPAGGMGLLVFLKKAAAENYETFQPQCLGYLQEFLDQMDLWYTDDQLPQVLANECSLGQMFPNARNTGFDSQAMCLLFSQNLVLARREELKNSNEEFENQLKTDEAVFPGDAPEETSAEAFLEMNSAISNQASTEQQWLLRLQKTRARRVAAYRAAARKTILSGTGYAGFCKDFYEHNRCGGFKLVQECTPVGAPPAPLPLPSGPGPMPAPIPAPAAAPYIAPASAPAASALQSGVKTSLLQRGKHKHVAKAEPTSDAEDGADDVADDVQLLVGPSAPSPASLYPGVGGFWAGPAPGPFPGPMPMPMPGPADTPFQGHCLLVCPVTTTQSTTTLSTTELVFSYAPQVIKLLAPKSFHGSTVLTPEGKLDILGEGQWKVDTKSMTSECGGPVALPLYNSKDLNDVNETYELPSGSTVTGSSDGAWVQVSFVEGDVDFTRTTTSSCTTTTITTTTTPVPDVTIFGMPAFVFFIFLAIVVISCLGCLVHVGQQPH